ncbi:amidohydrolase family protein [Dethiosulfovibrio salsuginis]|uniref:Dihydroorotase n=1 Tax=Dethiosulfovibrio salsuginis TaxID=561720 RepID=A0A1X7I8N5_9BACT|nr:hypothetical protein [Dethiosulfovibrio salsuginis]SMG10928.1 dihydroorotase [Dethiosulfovibrio salsuginis]
MGFVDLFVDLGSVSLDQLALKAKDQGIASVGIVSPVRDGLTGGVDIRSIPCAVGQDGSMKEMRKLKEISRTSLLYGGRRLGGDSKLLRTVMSYCSDMNCRLALIPDDMSMTSDSQVAEGRASSISGMKGFPSVAESTGVFRALELSRESGVSVHLHGISTARSIEIIRSFKDEGLNCSCSVVATSLCLTEEDLINSCWDPSFKTAVPLRSEKEQKALWEAIGDGTVDVVTSGYVGISEEERMVPFEEAPFGGTDYDRWIDSLFEVRESRCPQIPKDRLIHCLSSGPSGILGC